MWRLSCAAECIQGKDLRGMWELGSIGDIDRQAMQLKSNRQRLLIKCVSILKAGETAGKRFVGWKL